jgi:hypothetical protein
MNSLKMIAIETELVDEMRATMLSPGYGHPVSVKVATGHGPCRHCLEPFVVGDKIPQPGPVFVHRRECRRYSEDAGYPARLVEFGAVLDGYDERQRVVQRELVTDGGQEEALLRMFEQASIRYVLVRDAEAGCYDLRVERG